MVKIYRRGSGTPDGPSGLGGWGDTSRIPGHQETAELAKRFGAATDDTPHGMLPSQIEALHSKFASEFSEMEGSVYRPGANPNRNLLLETLGPNRSPSSSPFQRSGQIAPTTMGGSTGLSGGGQSLFTSMKPFQPEFEDCSLQFYPVHRRLANTFWRLYWKTDPMIGSIIEMLSDLPWSDFQLTGEGVDGEVKETMEYMLTECKIRTLLPYLIREFLVVGEVIPHAHFDDSKGIWSHVALHNPDQVNVVYSPFIKMDTIMEFVPDPKLREIVTSDHPMLARVREAMPAELLSHLRAGTNVPLSPVNATFIPRKLHPYDLRGTSIISRMWRTLFAEAALWTAFIATARRSANAITLVKLGDPTTGTIPPPSEEKKVASLLAQAENDPVAKIIYNYQISTETIGTPERLMSVNTHNDLFEKLKLVALGVSKSFVLGESSYSSSAAGLTVFLQRLKAMRDFFVNEWLMPKFFLPVAIANGWIKPNKAEASQGHVRVKRSALEDVDEQRYIMPTIEWAKSLDPNIDKERIDAMNALENSLHIKITAQKKYACLGLDSEEELKQLVEEYKFKQDLAGQDPALQQLLGLTQPAGDAGGGGAGGVMSPGLPPESFGMPGGEDAGGDAGGAGAPPAPGGDAGGMGPEGASANAGGPLTAEGGAGDGKNSNGAGPNAATNGSRPSESKNWAKSVLQPLTKLFDDFDPTDISWNESEPWFDMLQDKDVVEALENEDKNELWLAIEGWLVDRNYPGEAIQELSRILTDLGKVRHFVAETDAEFEKLAKELGVSIEESADADFLIGAQK